MFDKSKTFGIIVKIPDDSIDSKDKILKMDDGQQQRNKKFMIGPMYGQDGDV